MALTGIDYLFWLELRDEGLLPPDPSVLELGQANWYGDRDPKCLYKVIGRYAKPSDVPLLLSRLAEPGTAEEPVAFIQAESAL